MTMRWRSSSGEGDESTAATDTAAPEKDNFMSSSNSMTETAQTCESTTASSSSAASPIGDDEPDSTTSSSTPFLATSAASSTAAALTTSSAGGAAGGSSKQQLSEQQQQQPQSRLAADMLLASVAADPDGDPPYHRSAAAAAAAEAESSAAAAVSSVSSGLTNHHHPPTMSQAEQVVHEEDDDGNDEGDDDEQEDEDDDEDQEDDDDEDDDDDQLPSVDDSDQEVPWKPQATQSTCEFTHTITNYSQKRDSGCKKAEYSATTVDEFGNRWRLIVYVNGNGRASNHHLSLFLQVADADDLPYGWKKAVSYVLTLEHPSGPNLSYAKRNPDKTFKLCPKAIDWGWSQFITSDRIQQEGFVQNDSLVVRASVTVKSSSVCIDLEDAELYLKCAVEEGKPDAVQLCLDQGASVNCQFKDDLYTPLHTACSSSTGDDDSSSSPSNSNTSNSGLNQNSEGSMKVLNLLLEKGADGNACNKWRETPLLIAANNGHRAAVEALLKHGADPSLCSEAGWSALTFAAHKGYDDIVALLLRAGAPVNCRVTEDSSTPLHKACAGSKTGHLMAVKLLLNNGADVHALNKWRETPLLTAANHGQAGAVEALLKAGADPCKCTDTGWSPLSIAAYKGHDDVVKLLLEEGAPTEEADPTLSALLQAATKGLPDTVELLLKHGADHTVTTKKGDTALSILVEQNLIDAAVEMVTEYKASVPRCSRDRKKVQRARLLINHRVKQQQREGKKISLDDDDDETDLEEEMEATAQHDGEPEPPKASKNKKKKKKKKMSAEEQAKAAEEALLLELEQEDQNRQKQEQEANKKSAKKRKKKERERQQKKEQEEQRAAEERQKAEKMRKEREAREAKEKAEREKLAAIQRKEEEEERKRLQVELEKKKREQQQREAEQRKKEQQQLKKKQQQEKEKTAATSSVAPSPANKKGNKVANEKPVKKATVTPVGTQAPKNAGQGKATAAKPNATKQAAPAASRATGKNRGWETKAVASAPASQPEPKRTPPKPIGSASSQSPPPATAQSSQTVPAPAPAPSQFMTPQRDQREKERQDPFFTAPQPPPASSPFPRANNDMRNMLNQQTASSQRYREPTNGIPSSPSFVAKGIELPAVALFRRDKVAELLHRCANARKSYDGLGVVSENIIKTVVYRWMVRAGHDSSAFTDCIIPSWIDSAQLGTFFQRQFISESRKAVNNVPGATIPSIESLKEAGSTMARLCHTLAKEVADFSHRVEEQLPRDWSDTVIGMSAQETLRNDGGSIICIDWANRSQVYLSTETFTKLRERYVGIPSRLLSCIFSARISYDAKLLIVADTSMDCRLPTETQTLLSMKAAVSAEAWASPFSALSGNVFWGQLSDVDTVFGGLKPFSKEDGGEDILVRHGGSVSVMPPPDNMVASRYVHRMLDVLEAAQQNRAAVSFSVVLRSECFLDGTDSPTINDLHVLDPRLRDRNEYLSRAEQLTPGQHSFLNDTTESIETSRAGSLFILLQNDAGRTHFGINDASFADIIHSMGGQYQAPIEDAYSEPTYAPSMAFSASEYAPPTNDSSVGTPSGYFDSRPTPVSPMPQQNLNSDFGAIGGNAFSNAFSTGHDFPQSTAAGGPRRSRGRLFDLVDDGDEDNVVNDDLVSGMLGNLNMDLFQQPNSSDIDIEAISLMGIGGPPSQNGGGGLQPRSRGRFG